MRWSDGITDSRNMSPPSKLWEMVKDREALRAVIRKELDMTERMNNNDDILGRPFSFLVTCV